MDRKTNYRAIFLLSLIGCLSVITGEVLAAEIQGSVSLPDGVTASGKGMNVTIYIEDTAGNEEVEVIASIESGANSGIYTATVSDNSTASWMIYYSQSSDENYLEYGYYTTLGTSWDRHAATLLPGGTDYSDIDLTLLTGNVISGDIFLPTGVAPAGGLQVRIETVNINNTDINYSTTVTIEENNSSVDYSLRVVNDPDASWQVSYVYYQDHSYVPDGYYTSSGTTWNKATASLLSGNADHPDIDFTLLEGKTINGTISLPNAEVAPSGGIGFDVYVININDKDYYYSDWVTIEENQSFMDYFVRVPDDDQSSWQVHYEIYSDAYLDIGYYQESGTTWNKDASTLLPGGENHEGIDLTPLAGNVIEGQIFLPSGADTLNGRTIYLNITNNNGYTYQVPSGIAAGDGSANYSQRVINDPESSWEVSYFYWGDDFVNIGYYNTDQTTWDKTRATLAPGDQDNDNIDLTLIEGNHITGTVFLPSGRTATDEIEIHLYAKDAHGSGRSGKSSPYIHAGEQSRLYRITVPDDPDASWQIEYECYSDKIFRNGYYADSGTTWNPTAATTLPGDSDHPEKDISLLPGYEIYGKISLPSDNTPPEGGVEVHLLAEDVQNNTRLVPQVVTIGDSKDDSSWTDYAITVLDTSDATWRISYLYAGNDYLSEGYYAEAGTTANQNAANLLPGGSDYFDINMTMLNGPPVQTEKFPWALFLPAMMGSDGR